MAFFDNIITILVLVGVFLLAYSAIRHKDIGDTLSEIRDFIKGKAEDVKDKTEGLKYAN